MGIPFFYSGLITALMHFEKSISGVFVSIFLLSIAAGFGAAALIDILLLAKVRFSSNKPVLNLNYSFDGCSGIFQFADVYKFGDSEPI